MGMLGVCTSPNGVLGCKSATCPGASINCNLSVVRAGGLDDKTAKDTWNAIASDLTQLFDHEQSEVTTSLTDYEKLCLANTPVGVDLRLADIYGEMYKVKANLSSAEEAVAKYTKMLDPKSAMFKQRNVDSYTRMLTNMESKIVSLEEEIAGLEKQAEPFEKQWEENGRWSRAFLVTNGNGHVHKTRNCSTCYPTTEFVWLPQYSGQSEDLIVEEAGSSACTICFPSSPVEVLARASKIEDPTKRQERAERAAEKEKKAKEMASKSITNKDGSPLKTNGYGLVKTSRTAEVEAVNALEYILVHEKGIRPIGNPKFLSELQEDYAMLVEALANKAGITVEEQDKLLKVKAEKKVKNWL